MYLSNTSVPGFPTPIDHTFCIILDDAYDIKMDVDWIEELKGFFFSEVN